VRCATVGECHKLEGVELYEYRMLVWIAMKNAGSYCKDFQKQSKSTQQEITGGGETRVGIFDIRGCRRRAGVGSNPPISGADRDHK
jgi:hypothetical protein